MYSYVALPPLRAWSGVQNRSISSVDLASVIDTIAATFAYRDALNSSLNASILMDRPSRVYNIEPFRFTAFKGWWKGTIQTTLVELILNKYANLIDLESLVETVVRQHRSQPTVRHAIIASGQLD
jgi:hypothetical protein